MPRRADRAWRTRRRRISAPCSCSRGASRFAAAPTRSSAASLRCGRLACRARGAAAMHKLKDTDRPIVDAITDLLESIGGLARVRRLQAGAKSFDRAAWAKLGEKGW